MIRKIVIFIIALFLTFLQWWVYDLGTSFAQEKQVPKKPIKQAPAQVESVKKKGASPVSPTKTQATSGDANIGKMLFKGEKQFVNGGPPCIFCHSIDASSSETHGPNLMVSNPEYGGIKWTYPNNPRLAATWINSPATPVMGAIYSTVPITEIEINHIREFFKLVYVIYGKEKPPPPIEQKELPDGAIGHRYSSSLFTVSGVSPYKVKLVIGSLPPGLILNEHTGNIEGEPKQIGIWELGLRKSDANGKVEMFWGTFRVFRILTVGEHGTLKGFEGIQMALNMAKDMDEIRIEKGDYGGSGLLIPENKTWDHGIKISGGWNEFFDEKINDPNSTILDGEEKESRIITISNSKGDVSIENLTFRNGKGGAVEIAKKIPVFINNCIFINNSAKDNGGAVNGSGTFANSTFTDNSSLNNGGAVYGSGTFTNSTFTGNSAAEGGGAVSGGGTFTNCLFTNNSSTGGRGYGSYGKGGAVSGVGTFTNCTFSNNSAGDGGKGGAVFGGGTFTNCTFTKNFTAARFGSYGEGGAVYVNSGSTFKDCTFNGNSAAKGGGGAVYSLTGIVTYTNCTFDTNSTDGYAGGGAVKGGGKFVNCTFTRNATTNFGDAIAGAGSGGAGGAVSGGGTFTNCTFTSNTATNSGGAIVGGGIFTRSLFSSNSSKGDGGAVSGDGTYFASTFVNNSADKNGGAVSGNVNLTNSTFYGNKAKGDGGAVQGTGNIFNSIFYKNTANEKDNDIKTSGTTKIDYSLINHLNGAADFGDHNIMGDPKFVDPDNGDLHLRPDSPCINAGTVKITKKTILNEVEGNIDMGAYEWKEVEQNTSGEHSNKYQMPHPKYLKEKACPFEGCTYGKWKARKKTVIYTSPDTNPKPSFIVKPGEWVTAVTGYVLTTNPGVIEMLKDIKNESYGSDLVVKAGDIIYQYSYHGEGCDTSWHNGTLVVLCLGYSIIDRDIKVIEKSKSSWWVKIKNSNNQEGWTTEGVNFGNKDLFE